MKKLISKFCKFFVKLNKKWEKFYLKNFLPENYYDKKIK